MEKTLIEVRGLKRTYKGGVRALRGIDLDVGSGRVFALLGPNGAGKSTLVRILCTLASADGGTVRIDGIPLVGNMQRVRARIGVALQDIQLDPETTVRGHLTFQGRLFGLDGRHSEQRAEELMERFGLTDSGKRKAKELSGGNQRRLHIALALVHGPKLLFLDEPTVGMDPDIRASFWNEIKRLRREDEVSVFFTTQYLEEAERHAEELGVIDAGELVYRGTVENFLTGNGGTHGNLEEEYLRFMEARRTASARPMEVSHA